MKRNSRFGTFAAESYLRPAPDTTNLPNVRNFPQIWVTSAENRDLRQLL